MYLEPRNSAGGGGGSLSLEELLDPTFYDEIFTMENSETVGSFFSRVLQAIDFTRLSSNSKIVVVSNSDVYHKNKIYIYDFVSYDNGNSLPTNKKAGFESDSDEACRRYLYFDETPNNCHAYIGESFRNSDQPAYNVLLDQQIRLIY